MADRQIDLAWAGGFFDGEGHVGRNRNTVMLQVSQSCADGLPRDLVAFVGILGVGRIRGPFKYGQGRKDCYEWRVYGDNARKAAALLMSRLRGPKAAELREVFGLD